MREKEFLPAVRERLGIENLNVMQRRMLDSITEPRDIILLAPTGSGKTLSFALPALKLLKTPTGRLQAVIIAPTRELVLQIAHVVREVAVGYKVTALYGGHNVEEEKKSLSVVPDIVVATPGRLLDHLQRRNLDIITAGIVVLDEFDKALELGFEKEMKKIFVRLKNIKRIMLTSATRADILPDFLNLNNPVTFDYLEDNKSLRSRQRVHRVDSDSRDKLESLLRLLRDIEHEERPERSIIFVNHRESAERVAAYLKKHKVDCILYHGALDQREREIAISVFNNGTRSVLVSTDLAARGLDIENVESIIHYHQALTPEANTHRNGRTARGMEATGDIYVLIGEGEDIKEFVNFDDTHILKSEKGNMKQSLQDTIYIGGGRKDKISRGDILGFLTKECGLDGKEVGKIDVFDRYSLVAIPAQKSSMILQKLREKKLKGEKRKSSFAGS